MNKSHAWALLTAIAHVAVLCSACTSRKAPPPLPPDVEPQIVEAERLGKILLIHDSAAAHATDLLFRAGAITTGSTNTIRGWITVPEVESLTVRFVGVEAGRSVAIYDVTLSSGREPVMRRLDPPEPLPAAQQAAFDARQTAIAGTALDCSDRYNAVVFQDPYRAGEEWLVYLLPATTVSGRVMVGRHYRIRVSADGKQVLERTPLSKDCMYVDRPSAAPAGKVAALYATNLLSPTPNESHVFLSLREGLPFAVATSLGNWIVDAGRIRYLGRGDD